MQIQIDWYGRCCFLVELNSKKVLFDPYDRFCNVDIGFINADILISSSTWHDHGHIGASPKAWIYTYSGTEINDEFIITGIEAKENRGTPTVVFNLKYKEISITNFADLGSEQNEEFSENLSPEQKEVLKSTNIAFIRPSIKNVVVTDKNIHDEKVLLYCQPNIIFPEHYFPENFIYEHTPVYEHNHFLKPNVIVNEMAQSLGYPLREIDDYKIIVNSENIQSKKTIYKFLKIHPQVRYIK